MNKRAIGILLVGMFLFACSPANKPTVQPVINSTSPPAATQTRLLPTSIPQGKEISYKEMRMVMSQAEITNGYETEYGSSREPASGTKFLWIQIMFENTGTREFALPAPEHFSILFGSSEFKASYGHRKDHLDYQSLDPRLFQGQKTEAWLRFDIPAEAELKDLQFVFIPESTQIGPAILSVDYSWADHPAFFWQCGN